MSINWSRTDRRHCPLSVRHSIRILTSVCPCSLISSVRPFLYPHVTVCLFLYPHMIVCLSDLVSACYRLLALVSPCDRLSLSVLVSACHTCLPLYPHVTVSPSFCSHVTVCLPLFRHMIVSLSVLLSAYYHGEFDIYEPNEEIYLGSLCTHGSQLTMQMYYQYIRVFDTKSVTRPNSSGPLNGEAHREQ
jgi:hypothetical protein